MKYLKHYKTLLLSPEFLIDERNYKNYFRGVAKERLRVRENSVTSLFYFNKDMENLEKMYAGDLGYNGSDKNYLDFYDDGITVNYDYYPYFLAEQIYQTPTGLENPEEFVIRPLYTVYNEPFYTSTNNLFFVRG